MVQASEYSRGWRAFDIGIGAVMVILSAAVLTSPRFAAFTLTFLLYFGLLALGTGMIATGATASRLPRWLRASDIGIGAIAVASSFAFLAYPAIAVVSAIVLLSVGLLFRGALGIAAGAAVKHHPMWYRALIIGTGALAIVASGIVILYPAAGLFALVVLLSASLLIFGIEYIISGATGNRLPRYYGVSFRETHTDAL